MFILWRRLEADAPDILFILSLLWEVVSYVKALEQIDAAEPTR